jgi:hypothetical protein
LAQVAFVVLRFEVFVQERMVVLGGLAAEQSSRRRPRARMAAQEIEVPVHSLLFSAR